MDRASLSRRLTRAIERPERVRTRGPHPWTVAVLGPGGVGKSTLLAAILAGWRGRRVRAAVLAFDPESPVTGGALLGDRVRMAAVASDPGVFIRSLPATLARPDTIRAAGTVLAASGFRVLAVESPGIGQADADWALLGDTVLLLAAPGLGDAIQAMKAGVLEAADLLVVNKADLPDADRAAADLQEIAAGTPPEIRRDPPPRVGEPFAGPLWDPPILKTRADRGEGIAALAAALAAHRAYLRESGFGGFRRLRSLAAAVEAEARRIALARGMPPPDPARLCRLATEGLGRGTPIPDLAARYLAGTSGRRRRL